VTPEVFASHLELLEQGGYQVVSLQRIVDTLIAGGELDSKWVSITFDDAYRSVLTQAFPELERRGWPFTVFISTDFIDQGYGLYLNWDELRSLEGRGGLMANHTLNHEHLVRVRPEESTEMWLARVSAQVTESQARLDAELDHPAKIFAYPYGEFSEPLTKLLASLDFIAFGQQSGPVGKTSNPQAIPRFPLASGFDSVQSLAEKLRTEHLPLSDPEVPATLLGAGSPAPVLTLQIDAPGIRELNCFVGGQSSPTVHWSDPQTVTIEAERALGGGRRKYTCTAPFPGIRGAYYWHTHLWIQPRNDGSWYEG
jgi:peptidoglycan/xylan/chitin deacetylase (PgdA/CDA1 family)